MKERVMLKMYKCIECGRTLDCAETVTALSYCGTWCGRPAYEEVAACPYCGGAAELLCERTDVKSVW
ncbi:MAG: hypothetical protein J1E39_08850 [Eubacterium sp.]|nr:hypothetical protein [Eubacterium sp.]